VFDNISKDDLIIAFFPCIYFCATSQMLFSLTHRNYKNYSLREKTDAILKRSADREYYFKLAVKMYSIAQGRGLRLIMENPWSEQTFLKANFVQAPTIVDQDRTLRGDYFKKPTAYWYINCEPTHGRSIQRDKKTRRICGLPPGEQAGLCSEERSMISPDYARNFICDFIIGKVQKHTQLSLF
jgi:hypothetical protein